MSLDLIPTDTKTSVFDVLNSVGEGFSASRLAIVRPSNPAPGVGGFVFDIPEDDEITLRAVATDHYVEDNTAIVDQVGILPEEINLRGLVAEVVVRNDLPGKPSAVVPNPLPINPRVAPYPRPAATQTIIRAGTLARALAPGQNQLAGIATSLATTKDAASALISSDATLLIARLNMSPPVAQAVGLARSLISANKSGARQAKTNQPAGPSKPIPPLTPIVSPALEPDPNSLFGLFLDKAAQPPNQTRQARTFAYFQQLIKGRVLMTVETPWGTMTDMILLLVRASQNDESRFYSSFALSFKKIRTAGNSAVTAGQLAGRAAAQTSSVSNDGTAGKGPVTAAERSSIFYRMVANLAKAPGS